MDETAQLGVHTLVLSSEAFFARINDLIAFFDNAQYLYYVRSPLEILESGYNQSVKRHFATAPLKLAKKLQFGNLDKIDKLMTEKPELDIRFRLYGNSFFKDGDIVKDFLAQIGYNKPISSGSKPVNLSYSFEALEFKRQLNRLPDAPLHHMLDRFLQSYKGQTTSFSVLEKSEFVDDGTATRFKVLYPFENATQEELEAFKTEMDEAVEKIRFFDLTTSIDRYDSNTTFVVVHGLTSIQGASGFAEILNEREDTNITKEHIAISSPNYQIVQIHKNLEAYLKAE